MSIFDETKKTADLGMGGKSTTSLKIEPFGLVAVIIFLILLPVWLLSMGATLSFLRFMTQPALYGHVPVWMVIAGVILVILFINKNR